LVEDETKVKSKVSRDSRGDNLTRFCGAKENHCCVTNFNHDIGIGEVGYNNVLEAFTNNKIASFCKSHDYELFFMESCQDSFLLCVVLVIVSMLIGFSNNGMLWMFYGI
jgi:hypothetical protein